MFCRFKIHFELNVKLQDQSLENRGIKVIAFIKWLLNSETSSRIIYKEMRFFNLSNSLKVTDTLSSVV